MKELLPAIIGFLIVGNIATGYLANFIGIGKVIALGGLINFLAGVFVLLFSDLAKRKNPVGHEKNVSIG
ncbi:hypothetical protein [Bacillus smithii]|uniref:hypothetical protein n=1 Tax=Bacillus smithii TaxID=1479 RepID=UPI003D1E13B4